MVLILVNFTKNRGMAYTRRKVYFCLNLLKYGGWLILDRGCAYTSGFTVQIILSKSVQNMVLFVTVIIDVKLTYA